MGTVGVSVRLEQRSDRGKTTAALTAAGWVVGLGVTALILFTPFMAFAYHNPSMHLVLDSADACVALLGAYLLYGRFIRGRRLQDFLLCSGLVLLALAGIGVNVATAVFGGQRVGGVDVWVPLTLRLAGAVLVGAAAVVGSRPLRWRQSRLWLASGSVVALAILLLIISTPEIRLPMALDPSIPPTSTGEPVLVGHPLLLAAQTVAALCFSVASIAFTRQAGRRDDELLRWLGPACALAAFARFHYLLFPSLYTDWLYTGDLLRTGFYLLLLVGATREIRQYWTTQAAAAVLEDRRRLARELHDGVMQELAYIRAESRTLPEGSQGVARIAVACDRAMEEARAAVTALGHAGQESLGYVLHRSAQDMAERYGGRLEVELDDSVTADPEQQHALVRIAREATSNAVRHGRADRVRLRLHQDEGSRQLVIEDNGCGFDVARTRSTTTGFGLTSMQDRAHGLPGLLEVNSLPGRGTRVTVTW
jgi:signal transduction histidine kinase